MKKDTHKTKVIFRKFRNGGDIIALFPEIPGTHKWYADCMSYMYIGQYRAASVDMGSRTRPAAKNEYAPLLKELQHLGYNLEVIGNFTQAHLTARKHAVEGNK